MLPAGRVAGTSITLPPCRSVIASKGAPSRRSVSSSRSPITSQLSSRVSDLRGGTAAQSTRAQLSRPGALAGARISVNSGQPSSVTMYSQPVRPGPRESGDGAAEAGAGAAQAAAAALAGSGSALTGLAD